MYAGLMRVRNFYEMQMKVHTDPMVYFRDDTENIRLYFAD